MAPYNRLGHGYGPTLAPLDNNGLLGQRGRSKAPSGKELAIHQRFRFVEHLISMGEVYYFGAGGSVGGAGDSPRALPGIGY